MDRLYARANAKLWSESLSISDQNQVQPQCRHSLPWNQCFVCLTLLPSFSVKYLGRYLAGRMLEDTRITQVLPHAVFMAYTWNISTIFNDPILDQCQLDMMLLAPSSLNEEETQALSQFCVVLWFWWFSLFLFFFFKSRPSCKNNGQTRSAEILLPAPAFVQKLD